MDDAGKLVIPVCPNCGMNVDEDSRFCKFCSHSLTVNDVERLAPLTHSKRNLLPLIAAGVVCAFIVVAIAAVGVYVIVSRYQSSNTQLASASSPSPGVPSLGEKANNIEQRILRGESLNSVDLEGLTTAELRILRNVHFAKHGRKYDRPGLGDYFFTRPWYKPLDTYNDSLLTGTDKDNIDVILSIEKPTVPPKDSPVVAQTADVDPAPNPNADYLSQDQLQAIISAGIWSPYTGAKERRAFEILRVGQFNEQQKYWPVQLRVTLDHEGKVRQIWDIRVVKDDYGDWVARRGL